MRRASTCLALLGSLAVLGLPAAASAAPTVTFKSKAVPIPKPGGGTYPHTGNILAKHGGLGAALEANFVITGSGYGATPQNPAGGIPPLAAVNFFLPAGAKINSAGFPTCTEAVLKNTGPTACKKAVASPVGNALGEVTFGSERVPEEAKLQAFFGPNKGLLFFVQGSSPVSLEFVSSGTYVNSGVAPYGLELKTHGPRDRDGARRRSGLDEKHQRQGWRSDQKGQEADLLRDASPEVPEGGLPGEGRTDLRRLLRRRTRIRDPR